MLLRTLQVNIGLFIFNLLIPAYPLDGGRIFADILLTCGVAPVMAAKITVGVAFPISAGIIIWGAVVLNVMVILVSRGGEGGGATKYQHHPVHEGVELMGTGVLL